MSLRIQLIAIVFLVLTCIPLSADTNPENTKPHNDLKSTYTVMKIEGFKVLVSGRYKPHKELQDKVMAEVRIQLRRIALLLRPDTLKAFQKTEIWVELDYPRRCQYHPSAQWLKNNGYTEEKAGTVEIANAKALLAWQRRPVMTLLHELVHAYHDQILGFDEPRIKAAFERYKKTGAGKEVLRDSGHKTRHYALSNHKEFFAEMTEAYFWVNDYFPFVYGELRELDPETTKLLEGIWGKRR